MGKAPRVASSCVRMHWLRARVGPVLVLCSALRRVRGVNLVKNRLDVT